MFTAPSSSASASSPTASMSSCGPEQERQLDAPAAPDSSRRRSSCSRCAVGAAVLRDGGAHGARAAAPREPAPFACSSPSEAVAQQRRLAVGEELRVEAVHEDPGQLRCPSSLRRLRCRSSVSLTGISSGHATAQMAVSSGSVMNSWIASAWRLIGPDAGDVAEGLRGAQDPEPVAGGGRVDDHDVVLGRLLHPPVELRQLPHLADRDQLAQPRRGGGEVGEDPVLEQHVVERLHLDLQQQVLLQRALRIDREAVQVLGDLASRGSRRPCVWNSLDIRSCWATSQTIVRLPRRAAATPSAAATVDLPTPPLPVTKIRRLSSMECH